jgi:hypothetical protein
VFAQRLGHDVGSTFQRGLRLAYGSWKIICMRRRSVRGRLGVA